MRRPSTDLNQPRFTPEDADKIRSLEDHPGWQLYRQVLKEARIEKLNEAMNLDARDKRGNYDLGMHDGLMRAWTIPQWIIADSIEDKEQRIKAMPSEYLVAGEDLT